MIDKLSFVRKKLGLLTHLERRVQAAKSQWVNDNGDEKLRLEYDLGQDSVVFDVGGYKGQWTSDIYSMYKPKIKIFEPVPDYSYFLQQRFEKNTDIEIIPFGVGHCDTTQQIYVDGDASSLYGSRNAQTIKIMDLSQFLTSRNIRNIDLIKINIEGSEYDLINHLIDTNSITCFKNIQVQFHHFIANAEEKMEEIRCRLSQTHTPTYMYDFVWENWKIKKEL